MEPHLHPAVPVMAEDRRRGSGLRVCVNVYHMDSEPAANSQLKQLLGKQKSAGPKFAPWSEFIIDTH